MATTLSPNPVAAAFRMPAARTLVARPLDKSTLVATELLGGGNFGLTASMPRDNAWIIATQLRPCPDHDLFFEQRQLRPRNWGAWTTTIFDQRRDPVADIRDPFHSVMVRIPQSSLDEVAEEAGARRVETLHVPEGVGMSDAVISHLMTSVRMAIERPAEAPSLFLDHLAAAFTHHVARVYGGMRRLEAAPRGGLSPSQERRARELLTADLTADLTLAQVAREFGMSVRHFGRAFRQSVGVPPHRWVLRTRIERAQQMLRSPARALSEIATECGFADQSHFTRAFTGMVGVSPGQWRRQALGDVPLRL